MESGVPDVPSLCARTNAHVGLGRPWQWQPSMLSLISFSYKAFIFTLIKINPIVANVLACMQWMMNMMSLYATSTLELEPTLNIQAHHNI